MLKQLTVRNFALVTALDIEFAPGLTVITGESGAGKSILLSALALVLGERAATANIRPGAASCEVAADFELNPNGAAWRYLEARELMDAHEPNRCLVRRVVAGGRSRAFVNGAPVNLGDLQALCEPLVDIYGQHEHRSLLERSVQLSLLDDYAAAGAQAAAVRDAHRLWQTRQSELETALGRAQGHSERMDLLRYQADELKALAVQEGEFEALTAQRKRLAAASDIRATVASHATALDDDLIPRLARGASDLEAIDDSHPALAAAQRQLQAARVEAEEALTELRDYFDAVPEDAAALAEVDERLDLIHDVARKHRVAPASLARHAGEVAAELDALDAGTERLDELQAACRAAETAYDEAAAKLSKARHRAAPAFAKEVGAALEELKLPDATLEVEFTPTRNERGLEAAGYLVRTNPQYPPAALRNIASGGELARIGLAIEAVAAQRSALPCLVLDEADVGVGGATADRLGRMLRRLAEHAQVVCVTHAPQVAALGDTHLRVMKSSGSEVAIDRLDAAERVEELARMLAGRRVTEETRDYARTLLAGAEHPADAERAASAVP